MPAKFQALVRGLLQRRSVARELDDELEFHVEAETRSNIDAGMSPAEARRVALRDFGGIEQTKEAVRDVRTIWLESLWQDVRLALRMLRRNPGFAAASLLSLALGIGVNLSIFGFVNALFLRPVPGVADAGTLVSMFQRSRTTGRFTGASYPDFEYYREHASSFEGVMAYASFSMTLRAGDMAETVQGELVSDNYFSVLAARATTGRLLDPRDSLPGADPAVVVSDDCWHARFGGDPGIVGRTVHVGSALATIVGVAPRGFRGLVIDGPEPPSLWVPVSLYTQAVPALADVDVTFDNLFRSWGTQTFNIAGRLKSGTPLRQAIEEVTTLARQLDRERATALIAVPSDYVSLDVLLVPAGQARVSPADGATVLRFLGLLGAIAFLILLVACFNVANLILARSTFREHEIAVRTSLGASWWRIVQQLLTENVTLSVLAAAVSVPVGIWTSNILAGFGPASPMSLDVDVGIDGRVMLFAAAIAVFAGVLLTIFPARVAARASISHALGRRSRGFASRLGVQSFLVAVQVALCVVLLVGAGLFVRTMLNALAVDVTVRSDNVLLAKLDPGAAGYEADRARQLYSQLLDRVRAIPGVVDAAEVFIVPLGGRRGGTKIEWPAAGGQRSAQVGFNVVSSRYFQTVGIPLIAGRQFTDDDRASSPRVAVINEVMAQRLFAGRNAVGERFVVKWRPESLVQVVGVVRDGKFRSYNVDAEPIVYVPLRQQYVSPITLEVRTAVSPLGLAPAVRRELVALDRDLPLENALWRERLTATLLSGVGLLALALAAIGIYGILSFAVAQRTWEIGLRIALGARPMSVLSSVLGRTLGLVAAGAAAGGLIAAALSRVIRGLLYGVSPTDPLVIFSGIVALLAVAFIASFVPARRATTVDPVAALRSE
jgi:predicted permease